MSEEDVVLARREFQEQFSPDKLKNLSDSELLDRIFLSVNSNNQSLCYNLEFNKKNKQYFGSISGGSSYKFGLFQKQEDKCWMTGSPTNPIVLSAEDALKLGKKIRDFLVKGYEIIAESALETVDDYEALDKRMDSELEGYAEYAWFQKYFFMFFPEKLVGRYADEWLKHFLYGLGIVPKENYYSCNGQLSIVKRLAGLSSPLFQKACYKIFGEIKHFYRLGSSNENTNYAAQWQSSGIAAIGWNELSDLKNYLKDRTIDRKKLSEKMESFYYQGDARTASRKAGEIKTFYESTKDNVFVVVNGERLIGIVDGLGPYYFDPSEPRSHCKKGTWHSVFDETDRLPVSEGLQTTCYEIRKPENLVFLYSKYYDFFNRSLQVVNTESSVVTEQIPLNIKKDLPERLPRTTTRFPLNAILYGAPGTGKTYATIEYAMAVINDTDIVNSVGTQEERKAIFLSYKSIIKSGQVVFTTFHQSYGYEDFIQGLRPALNTEKMAFSKVDGIFKQIADRAMFDDLNNYVIIVDEINRANISKVFGELITLIETDKRWGEANEMSATLPSGDVFAIPNNLYIVGTMNSADKSISLIDTALRRRFDFIETAPNAALIENEILRQILEKLNEELLRELDSTDLLIGHAYFIGKTEEDLVTIMNCNIIPLLYEYFFDNSRKVKTVVNRVIEGLDYRVEDGKMGRIRIAKEA